MKRIAFVGLLIVILFTINFVSAQSYQKGLKNLDWSYGYGFYQTQAKFLNSGLIENDKTQSIVLSMGFEYALSNKIGIGVELEDDLYIGAKDTMVPNTSKSHSVDIALQGNYHFLNTSHIDLYGGLTYGISSLSILQFDLSKKNVPYEYVPHNGYLANIHFNARFHLKPLISLLLGIKYNSFGYSNVTTNYKYIWYLNTVNCNVSINGIAISTGFALSF